ncbi:hypothetical protein THAOC_21076 [Thalassiosira oceanica]|uniref:Transmembrane protein 222 n=1 Tax=Thalassiosira oceanica TaxID=159749 RepID=K0S1W3_THAOC|nr:hypothetical protein THAOC_21076 [Thalassiosira oceanica]|eukprot:EJK58769.1 hypothetical protein THAOC_21076 [Thalassiosira oceanica]
MTSLPKYEGHMGIGTSEGIVCDFQGPYYVSDRGRSMAFGNPTRALKVDISSLHGGSELWDECIRQANAEYNTRIHNLFCDNCHSHVAYALNAMSLKAFGIQRWDMVKLCFLTFFKARFLSLRGFVAQFLPFTLLVIVVVTVSNV